MAEKKIFAGAKLRRLRNQLGLTQSDMASALDISPSYLNLMERNQRPLTVQVLLKLSSTYQLDAAQVMADDLAGTAALRQIFTDPLLAAELPGPAEVLEVAEAAPNLSRAVVKLHEAYRDALERLSDASMRAAQGGADLGAGAGQLPYDQMRDWLEEHGPRFTSLEAMASEFYAAIKPRENGYASLCAALKTEFGVEVRLVPASVLTEQKARFDKHSMRLFISEKLEMIDRPLILAYHYAMLKSANQLDTILSAGKVSDGAAKRIGRIMLAGRMAEAILLPEDRLMSAIKELGLDLPALASRFGVRRMVVMARLCVLGLRPNSDFPRFSFIQVDEAGVVLRQHFTKGFPVPRSTARFGGMCARLPIYQSQMESTPKLLELSEGEPFFALTVIEPLCDQTGEKRLQKAMLICTQQEAVQMGYDMTGLQTIPIGVSCRLCERPSCAWRTHPPISKPTGFEDYLNHWSDYDLGFS